MEMVSGGNFNGLRSFQAILCHFGATKSHFWARTQNCRKLVLWHLKMIARRADIWWRWFQMSLSRHLDHFGQYRQSWVWGPNWPKVAEKGPKWPKLSWKSEKWHPKPSPFDFCFSCGHFEFEFGAKISQNCQNWPKKAPNDRKWPECLNMTNIYRFGVVIALTDQFWVPVQWGSTGQKSQYWHREKSLMESCWTSSS